MVQIPRFAIIIFSTILNYYFLMLFAKIIVRTSSKFVRAMFYWKVDRSEATNRNLDEVQGRVTLHG